MKFLLAILLEEIDEYSSEAFRNTVQQFFSNGIVQTESALLMDNDKEFVQTAFGQIINLLNVATLNNHCRIMSTEEIKNENLNLFQK